jgi:hypothetical protein
MNWNSSFDKWLEEPVPAEATVSLPGWDFASAIKPAQIRHGDLRMHHDRDRGDRQQADRRRSRAGSYGDFLIEQRADRRRTTAADQQV